MNVDAEWVETLRPLDNGTLDSFIKELAALELVRRRLISSGKSAELLKLERMECMRYASPQGIPLCAVSDEEFEKEMQTLAELFDPLPFM